jgi:hypothetical protein
VDLYAKAVALAGLGCLGIGGALIDYWPASEDFPAVRSTAEFQPAVSVLTLVDVPGFTTTNPAGMSFTLVSDEPSPLRARTRTVEPLTFPAEPVSFPAASTLASRALPVEATLGMPELPLESAWLAPAPAPEPALALADVDVEALPAASLMASNQDEDRGFLSSVLKKTGSSVSTSFGKAGSSLVGAFRLVGSAVKKAARF